MCEKQRKNLIYLPHGRVDGYEELKFLNLDKIIGISDFIKLKNGYKIIFYLDLGNQISVFFQEILKVLEFIKSEILPLTINSDKWYFAYSKVELSDKGAKPEFGEFNNKNNKL